MDKLSFHRLSKQLNLINSQKVKLRQKPDMDYSKCHLNTVYVQSSRQMSYGPYQSLKNQLSRQNYFNPQYIQKSKQDSMQEAMDQFSKMITDSPDINHQKLKGIHSIKLKPIKNQNFISSFDQNQYRLEPEDKVKIVKEKVFRVQNYYNYLYQLKCKEEHERIQEKMQSYLRKSREVNQQPMLNQKGSMREKSNQRFVQSTKSNNYDRNQSYIQQEQGLAPEYTKYQDKKVLRQKTFLKEKQRRKVQQQASGISSSFYGKF